MTFIKEAPAELQGLFVFRPFFGSRQNNFIQHRCVTHLYWFLRLVMAEWSNPLSWNTIIDVQQVCFIVSPRSGIWSILLLALLSADKTTTVKVIATQRCCYCCWCWYYKGYILKNFFIIWRLDLFSRNRLLLFLKDFWIFSNEVHGCATPRFITT